MPRVHVKAHRIAACGLPPRQAYRPCWRRGRVAEGGGLLNRYRVVKPYRGFESLRLRHRSMSSRCPRYDATRYPNATDATIGDDFRRI